MLAHPAFAMQRVSESLQTRPWHLHARLYAFRACVEMGTKFECASVVDVEGTVDMMVCAEG